MACETPGGDAMYITSTGDGETPGGDHEYLNDIPIDMILDNYDIADLYTDEYK